MNLIRLAGNDLDVTAVRVVRSASQLSSCRRRKVGAGIFALDGTLIATGYNKERPFQNGVVRSCLEGDCPRGMAPYAEVPADSPYSDCVADHAEIVALSKAYGTDNQADWFPEPDCVMIVTHKPCHECTPVLERVGLLVYYLEEM